MVPRAISWILLAVVLVILAAFGVVWAVVFCLVTVVTWLVRWSKTPDRLKLVSLVVVLMLIGSFYFTGAFPDLRQLPSAADSRLPGVAQLVATPNLDHDRAQKPPVRDALEETRQRLREEIVRYRTQDGAVERAFTTRDRARRIIEFAEKRQSPIKDLVDAKLAVDDSLKELALGTAAALRERRVKLREYLDEAERQATTKSSESELQDIWTTFQLQAPAIAFEKLSDHLRKLEDALNQFTKQFVAQDIKVAHYMAAALDENEPSGKVVRDQIIGIGSTRAQLTALDASEWTFDKDAGGRSPEVLVSYGPVDDAKPVADPRSILIPAGIKYVTLVKRSVTPVTISELPSKIRILPFTYFMFKWPRPAAVKLHGTLDLSAVNGPAEFPYAFDVDTDAPIKELRLPAWAYFTATVPFTSRPETPEIIEPVSELKPSYFLHHSHVLIELVPRKLRWQLVQDHKQYLFPENLIMALGIALAAALGGLATGVGKG